MPRFPTAGSRSADSSARRRGGIFGRCSHASEGWRTCTSRDPRTWTRWLQAEPVVELHQQDVGGPVEEQLPLEVPVQVERGIIRPVTRAALCPNDEERGARAILPAEQRVDLDRARAKVGILEREPLRGRRGWSVRVDDVARHGVRSGDEQGVSNGGAIVAAVPIERESLAGLELLEIAVVTGERERLRVQLQAQGRRKRGVGAQRHVELMLEQLAEDVARAERRGGRVEIGRAHV